jgi:molecular chaperone DnaJ
LELLIRVRAHREFQRQADEVMSELALPFVTATLGGPVTVTTLHGPVTHVVPSGTQAGTVLRLKGQGIPHRFRRGRGDHLLKVSVTIPTRLSARAEELVRQLDGELREDSSGSMFSRIKNWF